MEIKSTTNYSQFSTVKGNRDLILNHLSDLTTSILTRNLLEFNPIMVNESMQVLDGQHRLEVAKANNLPIYYVVIENAGIDEVMLLNKTNRKWNTQNFLQSLAVRGFKNYQWIVEFMENYKLSYTQTVWFLFGTRGGWAHRALQSGKVELNQNQKDVASERAEVLWTLRPFFTGRSGRIPQAMIEAIVTIHNEGLAKKLIQTVKSNGRSIKLVTNYTDSVGILRDILETR